MKPVIITIAMLVFFFISGCANHDRISATSFEPLNDCKDGYRCFKYIAFADPIFPEGDYKAEKYRLEMLRLWLKDNDLEGAKYEIKSRKAICTVHGLLGDRHRIYYEVHVNVKPGR